ncbi:hypothetical protein MLD38_009059 [Melastoma candidum]|uniref:Uncharacterized protein n=1 Tax=Melastoma candidum TaxID=119954 RepID=A0ACB9RXN0_9MYRT|nr:hypothetical protein MLD38_009059 [Melastoma candidum]
MEEDQRRNEPPPITVSKSVIEGLCALVLETSLNGTSSDAEGMGWNPEEARLSPPKLIRVRGENVELESDECATPKGVEYRIPKMETCPPAPKRQKNWNVERSPVREPTEAPVQG